MNWWNREISSFSDEIITTSRKSNDGKYWYAFFDIGPHRNVSDPDFGYTGFAKTKNKAIKLMADEIRTKLSTPRYKDLHWKCKKWWRCKELGLDKSDPLLVELNNSWDYSKRYEGFSNYEVE